MTKTILMLLSSILLFTACQKSEVPCSGFALEDSNISNPEEYLILEAILDEYFSKSDNFHIFQESHSLADSSAFTKYLKRKEVNFDETKKAEYFALNNIPYIWGESFNKKRDLLSKDELNCLLYINENGWKEYFDKYENSKAVLKFGRPVLDNNQALITYVHSCGFLCGYGYTVTLKKENNKWKVENRILIWIS